MFDEIRSQNFENFKDSIRDIILSEMVKNELL